MRFRRKKRRNQGNVVINLVKLVVSNLIICYDVVVERHKVLA